MRDPYCVGFWISIVLAISAIGIYFTGVWLQYDLDKAFAYLNALGTFFAGLAGLFVAGVTLYGLNLWRFQLYGSKYLTVIWDAQSALRVLEAALIEFQVLSIRLDGGVSDAELSRLLNDSSFGSALLSFREKCQVLDRVVVKNEWQWSNYSSEIQIRVHDSLMCSLRCKAISDDADRMKCLGGAIERSSRLSEFLTRLNKMLDALESKHGIRFAGS